MTGRVTFTTAYGPLAAKIDSDPHITNDIRNLFWQEIEIWDAAAHPDIQTWAVECCEQYYFVGPIVSLGPDESLGRAQRRLDMQNWIATERRPGIPNFTLDEVKRLMTRIEREPDRGKALVDWKASFSDRRLPPVTGDPRKFRVFAFRNLSTPSEPLAGRPLNVLFTNLTIPAANALDYVAFAFRPAAGDFVHLPTCLDANMWNMSVFVPGGTTAGGMPEVVVTPPRCIDYTAAPQGVL